MENGRTLLRFDVAIDLQKEYAFDFDLDDSKAAIEAAGLRWQVQECQPIPAYSAYIGKVVDQEPLGDPPGTDARPPLTRVILYVGVASGTACPHTPPP